VTEVRVDGGRVSGVRTVAGESFGADVVVNCAGRWADEVAHLAGLRIPLTPTMGLLVFTAPFLGRAVAEEITRSRVVPQLEHFRPSRFAAAGGRG